MLRFKLTQHSRDEQLMKNIQAYLDATRGKYSPSSISEHGDILVWRFMDIVEKIIPLFSKYPIMGVKLKDFQDFCLVAELIKENKHLSLEGLEQIRNIKAGMNKGRDTGLNSSNSPGEVA